MPINPDNTREQGNSHSGIPSVRDSTMVYNSADLIIIRLSSHAYQHISYLMTSDFGKVACNGMIVADHGEAIVFDTPASLAGSNELIAYVSGEPGYNLTAVIPTYFHKDCVAGLEAYIDHRIPVYAYSKTFLLLGKKAIKFSKPIQGFDKELTLEVGGWKVLTGYFGEGQITDNIIGYYPREKALFGGCLMKAMVAGMGNLADANIREWPETVKMSVRNTRRLKL